MNDQIQTGHTLLHRQQLVDHFSVNIWICCCSSVIIHVQFQVGRNNWPPFKSLLKKNGETIWPDHRLYNYRPTVYLPFYVLFITFQCISTQCPLQRLALNSWFQATQFFKKKATHAHTNFKNICMTENHFKFNCISGHVISVSTGSGTVVLKVSATVWMEHSCSWTDISSSLQHRLRQIHTGKPPDGVCLGVCPRPTFSVACTFTYPIQSFGLNVAKELLSPISGHPGGDILRLLWYDRSHFNGVLRCFLRASCQSIVRGHLLQQGSHGGTSWHWTGLRTSKLGWRHWHLFFQHCITFTY